MLGELSIETAPLFCLSNICAYEAARTLLASRRSRAGGGVLGRKMIEIFRRVWDHERFLGIKRVLQATCLYQVIHFLMANNILVGGDMIPFQDAALVICELQQCLPCNRSNTTNPSLRSPFMG